MTSVAYQKSNIYSNRSIGDVLQYHRNQQVRVTKIELGRQVRGQWKV